MYKEKGTVGFVADTTHLGLSHVATGSNATFTVNVTTLDDVIQEGTEKCL